MIATRPAQEGFSTAEELVAAVADPIRRTAAEAEAMRRLPDEFMRRLKDAGLFSIYTPKEFGGLELPLPEGLRVVEEVARHDGSTGWTVALGLANGVFTDHLIHAWDVAGAIGADERLDPELVEACYEIAKLREAPELPSVHTLRPKSVSKTDLRLLADARAAPPEGRLTA